MVWPLCSNFRLITAMFSSIQTFRNLTIVFICPLFCLKFEAFNIIFSLTADLIYVYFCCIYYVPVNIIYLIPLYIVSSPEPKAHKVSL